MMDWCRDVERLKALLGTYPGWAGTIYQKSGGDGDKGGTYEYIWIHICIRM